MGAQPDARPRSRRHTVLRWAGEVALTLAVVLGLFVVYLLWWTGVATAQAQGRLGDDLRQAVVQAANTFPTADTTAPQPNSEIDPAPPVPAEGQPYLDLRIPRLGGDWHWVVVEGVRLADLALGPGHYPRSAGPGEVGNLAIAGHRSGHGEPFAGLDAVRTGDAVELTFGERRWVYVVDRTFVTDPADVDVVAPVPGQPGMRATSRRLTLTTCEPRWGSERRLVVVATLREQG